MSRRENINFLIIKTRANNIKFRFFCMTSTEQMSTFTSAEKILCETKQFSNNLILSKELPLFSISSLTELAFKNNKEEQFNCNL